MRILVDGFWWYEGPQSNRMVLLEIVKKWATEFPDDELIIAASVRPGEQGQESPPAGFRTVRTHLRLHPAINAIELPRTAHRLDADALLTFNYSAISRCGVVFVHDVLFQTNPEWFTPVERAYFSAIPILAKRARTVITTSATERERIIQNNPNLTRVVSSGLAVSSSFVHAEPNKPGLPLAPDSFVLCIGRFNVRKNLEVTVRAIVQSGLLSEDFPLVLVGEESGARTDISRLLAEVPKNSILFARRLTEGELKWLYANCSLFVCLSLDEGFGLPVVEAATLGAPVLASDIAVFRENLGAYATYVDPTDIEAIASAARGLGAIGRDDRARYVEKHSWTSVCHRIRGELVRQLP